MTDEQANQMIVDVKEIKDALIGTLEKPGALDTLRNHEKFQKKIVGVLTFFGMTLLIQAAVWFRSKFQ